MKIHIIAAMAQNGVIGKGNSIPWRIPGEQKRFKDFTVGNDVIMGRKTYESIGHGLPGRNVIVLSRGAVLKDVKVTDSLESAIDLCGENIFIAGGGQVYAQSLPLADILYLTVLDRPVEGDVFFPLFDKNDYLIMHTRRVEGPDPYTYLTYERKHR